MDGLICRMPILKHPALLLAIAILIGHAAPCSAEGVNVAKGKVCRLLPPTDYWLGDPPTPLVPNSRKIFEEKDAAALVDGVHGSDTRWVQPQTPCFVHSLRPRISIDLGQVYPIERVRFYAAGGSASAIRLPLLGALLLSEDGKEYRLAGTVNSFAVEQEGKAIVHPFDIAASGAPARYVQVILQASQTAVCVDEVEVFAAANLRPTANAPMPAITDAELDALFDKGLIARWVASEWLDIRQQIRRMAPSDAASSAQIARESAALDAELAQMDVSNPQAAAHLHGQALLLRARAARPRFGADLICHTIDPWTVLRGSTFLPDLKADRPQTIDLSLWRDEYGSAALAITNLSTRPMRVSVRPSPLRNDAGQTIPWKDRLWLRAAMAIPVRAGDRVLDPIPLLDQDRPELDLVPGECRVLWLTLRAWEMPAGRYRAQLEIAPAGSEQPPQVFPVTLSVAPLRMGSSDDQALWTCAWDYLKGWGQPPEAAADMRAHGINGFILHPESLPRPLFNAERTKLEGVDFRVFDEALARAGHPRWHACFWGADGVKLFDLDKPADTELFKQWIAAWAGHLKEKGFGPESYFFYPYDELLPERFIQIAKLIKEVDPHLQVFCNQVNADPELMRRAAPYIDVWDPYYRHFDSELTTEQRQAFDAVRQKYHPKVWTYACDGPGKTLSPDTYYRKLGWFAFAHSATGLGVWCYAESNNQWNDYGAEQFGLVYFAKDAPPDVTRAEAVIPSRRWEAWRQTIQDYEYLHQLQGAIAAARAAGAQPSLVEKAQGALDQALRDVQAESRPSDRYDRARRLITEAILDLSGKPAAENIARGKRYTMAPAPNYDRCTDAGDASQLTDGQAGSGALWLQPTAVGWSQQSRPMVTIDLGQSEPIGRVCFNTVGGGSAGVYFPAVAVVLVSDDGKAFRFAGAVGSGLLAQDGKQTYTHRYELKDLKARGRYVRLAFQPEERFVFLDEVEVYPGPGEQAASAAPPVSDERLNELMQTGLSARWITSEWLDVKEQTRQLGGPWLPAGIAEKIAAVDDGISRLDVIDRAAMEGIQRQYNLLRAEVAQPVFKEDVVCQVIDPWSEMRGSLFPAAGASSPRRIDLATWQDGHDVGALLLANLKATEMRLRVHLTPLTDEAGRQASWNGRLRMRQALPVPVRLGYRVFDPLVLLGSGDENEAELVIPAGAVRVLWLAVHASKMEPGRYRASLELTPAEGTALSPIAVNLDVGPLAMPAADGLALNSCHWDYLYSWSAPPQAAQDLRAHGTNTFILHPETLPSPVFNAGRTRLESVDFRKFDEAFAVIGTPLPRWHSVFWGANGLSLFDLSKPSEQELFRQWIAAWVEHLKQKGIGPDRFFFYPVDEGITDQMVEIARLIKQVDPRLLVYCNQLNADPALIGRIGPYIDIWCAYHRYFTQDLSQAQREAFKAVREKFHPRLWSYACDGPGKTLSPDAYYRRLAWLAFEHGAEGAGFWCYGETDGGWDDYQGGVQYGMVYYSRSAPPGIARNEVIVPSRRWEAWLQGVEDYQHLHELKQAIAAARRAGGDPTAIAQAQRVLEQSVQNVLAGTSGGDRYARARSELTAEIVKLRQLQHSGS